MVWHVHQKSGKYAIWSTIIDEYITHWGTKQQVIAQYCYEAFIDAIDTAEANLIRAKEYGCSAMPPFRCSEFTTNSEEVEE